MGTAGRLLPQGFHALLELLGSCLLQPLVKILPQVLFPGDGAHIGVDLSLHQKDGLSLLGQGNALLPLPPGEAQRHRAQARPCHHPLPSGQVPLGGQVAPGLLQGESARQNVLPKIGGALQGHLFPFHLQQRQHRGGPRPAAAVDKLQKICGNRGPVFLPCLAQSLQVLHGKQGAVLLEGQHLCGAALGEVEPHCRAGVIVADEKIQRAVQPFFPATLPKHHQVVVGVKGFPPGGQGEAAQSFQNRLSPAGEQLLALVFRGGGSPHGHFVALRLSVHTNALNQNPLVQFLAGTAPLEHTQPKRQRRRQHSAAPPHGPSSFLCRTHPANSKARGTPSPNSPVIPSQKPVSSNTLCKGKR